jgi:hypothetical protein
LGLQYEKTKIAAGKTVSYAGLLHTMLRIIKW